MNSTTSLDGQETQLRGKVAVSEAKYTERSSSSRPKGVDRREVLHSLGCMFVAEASVRVEGELPGSRDGRVGH
jgi:hypothetical protein